jgi:hypothetical protein
MTLLSGIFVGIRFKLLSRINIFGWGENFRRRSDGNSGVVKKEKL